MDYGCGEATSADHIAAASGHLTMVEAAPNVLAALKARYAATENLRDHARGSPRQAGEFFDLIVLHSVAQYCRAKSWTACSRNSAG